MSIGTNLNQHLQELLTKKENVQHEIDCRHGESWHYQMIAHQTMDDFLEMGGAESDLTEIQTKLIIHHLLISRLHQFKLTSLFKELTKIRRRIMEMRENIEFIESVSFSEDH